MKRLRTLVGIPILGSLVDAYFRKVACLWNLLALSGLCQGLGWAVMLHPVDRPMLINDHFNRDKGVLKVRARLAD